MLVCNRKFPSSYFTHVWRFYSHLLAIASLLEMKIYLCNGIKLSFWVDMSKPKCFGSFHISTKSERKLKPIMWHQFWLFYFCCLDSIRITFSPIKINAEYQKIYFSNHGNKWSRCKTRAPDTQSHILNTHCLETYELL